MIVARGGKDKFCQVYAFSTFFYSTYKDKGYSSIRRWTKKTDIFAQDIVFIPVHLGMHWCLATIDLKKKEINYYDSMGGNNQQCLDLLFKYLKEEHQDKKKSELSTEGWKLTLVKGIPQQMNGSDCGMFACKFAEYLSRRARISFTQENMPYFRRRMVYEIVKNNLMYP
ncbi:sentrin-specific protease 1 [Eurytemora carolleeae]|uniref:sentrin-specific protease 1 n=1 Tax=Eurytemora carolleeae TaxID=1294199 RepID=UPI000C76A3DA|nr:sentrin-specific protease 1 [Eurytemora carolleeae]|eukprot:XP_023321487.1 sentrin-specific protease 1-like [Eurytemora affinis]